ncbi:MAG: element excision factor XisH family protein [Chloroflexota bacterium]
MRVIINALDKEDWCITDDPLYIRFLDANLKVDLGAERMIAAEKGNEKIAVEIKTFLRSSLLSEFHKAVGQYLDYKIALQYKQPERVLYLAVPIEAYEAFFLTEFGKFATQHHQLNLMVYEPEGEVILEWLPLNNTGQASTIS